MHNSQVKLSLVIPAKSKDDPKLDELLRSIDEQDFSKDELEVLVITEGTSESAKAIGIRRAKGDVIGILASDNELIDSKFLSDHYEYADKYGSSQPSFYHYRMQDNILNRYFSLIGCNDPIAHYLGKKDRYNYTWYPGSVGTKYINGCGSIVDYNCKEKTIGDNGYFVKKSLIEKTDLDNYYHIDNACEVDKSPIQSGHEIWHKTGGNIFSFFRKRYHYAINHAFNENRRWHLVDFSKPKDIWRLIWFVLATLTLVQPLITSFRGWIRIRDVAWFMHPLVCFLTLVTYTVLMIHIGVRKLSQSLFAPMVAQRA